MHRAKVVVYFLCLVCTFHVNTEMYGAPPGADDFGTYAPDSHRFGPVRTVKHYWSGGWRVKGQTQVVF